VTKHTGEATVPQIIPPRVTAHFLTLGYYSYTLKLLNTMNKDNLTLEVFFRQRLLHEGGDKP
jgi:hypothetical protein